MNEQIQISKMNLNHYFLINDQMKLIEYQLMNV